MSQPIQDIIKCTIVCVLKNSNEKTHHHSCALAAFPYSMYRKLQVLIQSNDVHKLLRDRLKFNIIINYPVCDF